jgi:hypothetical protein
MHEHKIVKCKKGNHIIFQCRCIESGKYTEWLESCEKCKLLPQETTKESTNFMQVGRMTECSKCKPEKDYADYHNRMDCSCVCHDKVEQKEDLGSERVASGWDLEQKEECKHTNLIEYRDEKEQGMQCEKCLKIVSPIINKEK